MGVKNLNKLLIGIVQKEAFRQLDCFSPAEGTNILKIMQFLARLRAKNCIK
jgi:hypothetical protein